MPDGREQLFLFGCMPLAGHSLSSSLSSSLSLSQSSALTSALISLVSSADKFPSPQQKCVYSIVPVFYLPLTYFAYLTPDHRKCVSLSRPLSGLFPPPFVSVLVVHHHLSNPHYRPSSTISSPSLISHIFSPIIHIVYVYFLSLLFFFFASPFFSLCNTSSFFAFHYVSVLTFSLPIIQDI